MSAYALPGLFPPLESSFQQRSYHADLSSLEKEEKVQDYQESSEVGIDIKAAKIDAAKLVESLTATKKTPKKKKQEPSRCTIRRPRHERVQAPLSSPQEEAMQFQLSVSLNGQTYTAVRSLPRIRQLRQELVEEQQQQQSVCRGESRQDDITVSKDCPLIPEIPRLQDTAQTGSDGFAGRGFSFLQAILRSYTPTLEAWLRQVTTLVSPSSSPSLTHFLWEPDQVEKELSQRPSLQGLDAIEESDSENDCFEDDE